MDCLAWLRNIIIIVELLSLVKEYHNYCRRVGNTNGTPCVRVIKGRPYDPQVRVMLLCI